MLEKHEKIKILTVDDRPENLIALESVLDAPDLDILKATSGNEALGLILKDDFALVLLDVQMPEMDGFETAELMRGFEKTKDIPIIFVTAINKEQSHVFKGYEAGAVDYLFKPIDTDILKSKVKVLCELHRQKLTLEKEIIAHKQTEAKLARANAELEQFAYYDPLTGLANRALFQDRLPQAIGRVERNERLMGLMFLDLDRFKEINDTLGHDAGDVLLQSVAKRLEERLRRTDTIARLGGDEFTIILEGLSGVEEVAAIAQEILDVMDPPFTLEGHEVFVSTSIGIAIYPNDGDNTDVLMKNADAAMYRAKEHGRNNYQFYTADMNAKSVERLALESRLRRALEREEFQLYYQPQVDLNTGQVIGMEALIRWRRSDTSELVSPAEFIPLAEETGLIVPIGEWVMRTACAQNRAWQDAGLPPLRVAVNLSARQFRQDDLADYLAKVLKDARLAPQYLELELTEGHLIEHSHAGATLAELKAMGHPLSVDDFGTGYSSLSYLKRFPIDTLKIDRSFVMDITTDPDAAAIANAIIALAQSLRLKVIAEGVETEGQLDFLRSKGCHEVQGYLFGPPIPAEQVAQKMQNGWGLRP